MGVLDLLGIDKSRTKKKMPVGLNYIQQQEWKRAQEKKKNDELKERTAHISTPTKERPCPICEKLMSVPVGTIMHCHSECKPRYKRAVRRLAKR